MEHYDGEFYTLRLFSPIEGEIYSLNSTEEGTHLPLMRWKTIRLLYATIWKM